MMNEKWYWIELIGFDNQSNDYGVKCFLEKLENVPYGISFLFSNLDFINTHVSKVEEFELKPCDCAYSGHKYSEERERQAWTNFQLKGLIKQLQYYGVKVVFGFFNFFTNGNDDGTMYKGKFCSDNTEIWDLNPEAEKTYSINILKRLRDGSYYEDYLFGKIKEVIEYYGFDGVQLADGISSARLSVQNGDCSDDLFEQFVNCCEIKLPHDIYLKCNENIERFKFRRDWIFSKMHFEWLEFLCGRWETFYRKCYDVLSNDRCMIIFNSAWTRDPFEAMYRYGIDYGKIFADKAYAIMVEEVSATRAILSSEDQGGYFLAMGERRYFHYEFMLMQMKIKAYLPTLKQLSLAPIKDTNEQWDILRHSPMEMERAILRRRSNFIKYGDNYVQCSASPFYCLSDSVPKKDWQYLERLEKITTEKIENIIGFNLLWSDNALHSELKHYIKTRDYTSNELSCELIKRGLTIASMLNVKELDKANTPILALNPQYYSKNEKTDLNKVKLPLMIVSDEKFKLSKKADYLLEGKYLNVYFYNFGSLDGLSDLTKKLTELDDKIECDNDCYDFGGAIWTMPLKYNRVNPEYFKVLSDAVNKILQFPINLNSEVECKITTFKIDDKNYRMLISNDEYNYSIPNIKFPIDIKYVKSLTKFHGYEISISDNAFLVRVPPRGMEALDIQAEDML